VVRTVAGSGATGAPGGIPPNAGGTIVPSTTVGPSAVVGSGGAAAVSEPPGEWRGIVEAGGRGVGGAGGDRVGGAPGHGGAGGGATAATVRAESTTGGSTVSQGSAAAAGTSAGQDDGIATQSGEIVLRQVEARGLTFDVRETLSDGEPVLLLHGFPDTSLMWTGVMSELAANGYHCLAPDQRGYSPGARPTAVDAYRYEELIADAFALGAELGERYHVVAHDWGANIAWLMLEADPSPIASFTAIAIPHYQVWARTALADEDMAVYRSLLSVWMTPGQGEDFWTPEVLRDMWSAKPAEQTEQTIAHMLEPGAMTAALNWYRASDGHRSVLDDFDAWEVSVPTLLIFGSEDMGQSSVADSAPLMTGPYRVLQPRGAHFIVDEQPQIVVEEILAHLQANPLVR